MTFSPEAFQFVHDLARIIALDFQRFSREETEQEKHEDATA
jgi:hypothetical protein